MKLKMKFYDQNKMSHLKLFNYMNEFKNFENIEDNQIYEIMEKVEKYKKYHLEQGRVGYEMMVNYLNAAHYYPTNSFDSKMFFLILCFDPNLVHFYSYIETSFISNYDIKNLSKKEDIKQVEEENAKRKLELEKKIRNILGFYDINLIDIEFSFFKKFLSNKFLVDNVQLDMSNLVCNKLLLYSYMLKFNECKTKRILDSSNNYLKYLEDNNKKLKINTLLFNTFYQSEILQLKNDIEKLFFFISTIDRNCTAVLYFDELDYEEKINKIENLVGFYDENFIKAEKVYKKVIDR